MVSVPHPLRGHDRTLPQSRLAGGSSRWVVAGIAMLGLAAMLPVLQKSVVTSQGFTLQARQAEIGRLEAQIHLREADVARLLSQDRIARRARQLGLFPASDPIYVQVAEPGPEPAKIPAEFLTPGEPAVDEPASWWRSLLRGLPLPR